MFSKHLLMHGGGGDSRIAPNMIVYETNTDGGGSLDVGEYPVFEFELPSDATGTAVIGMSTSIVSGVGILQFDDNLLSAGTHTVTAYYSGDSKYLPDTDTVTYTIDKVESYIIISVPMDDSENNVIYGNTVHVNIICNGDATGTATLTLTREDLNTSSTYTVNISNGVGSYDIEGVVSSEYEYTLSGIYNGNDKYLSSEGNEANTDSVTFTIGVQVVIDDTGQGTVHIDLP